MSHHQTVQTQYIQYQPPGQVQQPHSHLLNNPGVAPQDTTHQPISQHPQPRIATGDWTKDLVQLAKTSELKKHALSLQLHTAHILSAHASLEQKNKAIQDLREQKNKLESERQRLLNSLRQVNEDRDQADLLESTIEKECGDLRLKITHLTDGEYAVAKRDVDRLRQELGQPPLPSLQSTLDEKSAQYLTDRRLNGKRSPETAPEGQPSGKRPRGRPRGSKNRNKDAESSGP